MDIITKQKTYFWVIAVLIVVNLVTLYFMWSYRSHPPKPKLFEKGEMKGFLFKELGLDSMQQKLFDQYRDEHFRMTDSLFRQIGEVKKAILDEALLDNPDKEKIDRLTKRVGELNTLVETSLFDHFTKLKSVLKGDQLKKFKKMISETFKMGLPGGGNFQPPSSQMMQNAPPGRNGMPPMQPPPGR
ncbi:MAG: hypothetical protein V1720_20525 [bacterium]